ncbi:hypothetical protein NGC52_22955, partial [Klebsiella michiganensis]|uniref:hypothetical protein n=1 Tax=Klebsiella michiganensis TaxID=1134687 RepID=UPI002DBF9EB8
GKNSLNRLIRCVCGKKIGPDPRNFNQRVSLGRNDLLIRTFLSPMPLKLRVAELPNNQKPRSKTITFGELIDREQGNDIEGNLIL